MLVNNNMIIEASQIPNNNNYLNTDDDLIMIPDPNSALLEISRHGKRHKTNFLKGIFKNKAFTLQHFNKYSWQKEGCSIIYSDISHINLNEKRILKCLNLTTIPKEHRRNYWLTITGAKREMANHPSYYADLTTHYPDYIPNPNAKQIQLDIHRTFPEEEFYTNEANLLKIERICNAYGRRCYSIGYCQGFNQMVGRILEVVKNEEEAFWVFTQVVEQCLPFGFFCELAEMLTYYKLVTSILQETYSHIYKHLQAKELELYFNNIIYKWLLSLFLQSIHPDVQMIIWDMLLLEGTVVLFKSIIALVGIFENEIMNLTSLEEANVFFGITIERKLTESEIDIIKKYLVIKLYNFNEEELKEQKNIILPETIEEIKNSGKYLPVKAEQQKMTCDLDWPLCVYDYKYRKNITDFCVYSKLNGIDIKDNYLDKFQNYNENKDNKQNRTTKEEIFSNVLIQRNKHCCNSNVRTISNVVNKMDNGEKITYNILLQTRKEIFDKYNKGNIIKREDLLNNN